MPTYEYICDACEHAFDEFQPISAKPLKKCPSCAKPKLRRLIGTGAGFIFKGSGFYETDYRSEGYRKAAKADAGGDPGADPGAATGGGSGGEKKADADAKEPGSTGGSASKDAKPAAKTDSGKPVKKSNRKSD